MPDNDECETVMFSAVIVCTERDVWRQRHAGSEAGPAATYTAFPHCVVRWPIDALPYFLDEAVTDCAAYSLYTINTTICLNSLLRRLTRLSASEQTTGFFILNVAAMISRAQR